MVGFDELWASAKIRKNVAWVTRGFSKKLDKHERLECGMIGLWRTIDWHRPGGQSFEKSLRQFVKWECLRLVKKKEKYREVFTEHLERPNSENYWLQQVRRKDNLQHLKSRLAHLNPAHQLVIQQFYFQGMTLAEIGEQNGCSNQNACQTLRTALNRLREACLDTV